MPYTYVTSKQFESHFGFDTFGLTPEGPQSRCRDVINCATST
jgi:chromosome segregation and condensation protein ScpB